MPGTASTLLPVRLVRIALLVRQVALLAAVLVTLTGAFDGLSTSFVVAIVLTSQLGLRSTRLLRLVERHPSLALVDVLLVFGAVSMLGSQHPTALAAVSSALIIGVLFRVRVSVLLVALLVIGHIAASREAIAAADVAEVVGFPILLLSVAAVGSAFRRLSEQQSEAERDAATSRDAAVAAEERLRLARDVHDTLAKSVQGVALAAAALPHWIARDPEVAAQQAHAVAASARAAVNEARSLLFDLRLDEPSRPFADVLRHRVEQWGADRDGQVGIELAPVSPLDPTTRHQLLAAVCEALENVTRHAPGSRVSVSLTEQDCSVRVTVCDDGPGFTVRQRDAAVAADHYGLVGMEERMASIGGSAVICSAVGRGTEVTLIAPRTTADRAWGGRWRAGGTASAQGLRSVS